MSVQAEWRDGLPRHLNPHPHWSPAETRCAELKGQNNLQSGESYVSLQGESVVQMMELERSPEEALKLLYEMVLMPQ